jgi:uncharacterized protein YkwD
VALWLLKYDSDLSVNYFVMPISSTDLATIRSQSLTSHNAYRLKHHAPNLTIADALNATAQSWAEYLAANALFQHSTAAQRNNAGENIYVSYTTAIAIAPNTLSDSAVANWYNEVSAYNYAVSQFSSATGHFTQVVWKASTLLGCGAASGIKTINGIKYNAFYVVCQYNPAGNFTGQFANNVLKP